MSVLISALLTVLLAGNAMAEVVYVEPLVVGADLVTGEPGTEPPCDVAGLMKEGLRGVGCSVIDTIDHVAPEVMVNSHYESVGNGGWLTVTSFDVVVGRKFTERRYYLGGDGDCTIETGKMVRQVAFPPFYESNKALMVDNVSGIEFILVPGGTVKVGESVQRVKGFFLARYETTQAQWEKTMGYNPSVFRDDPQRPVENVSWLEVQEYLEKLRQKGSMKYRLPSELEWEYAARTRGRMIGYAGTDRNDELGNFAWTSSNSGSKSHRVGEKLPNGLGLYDMSGNVSEWCSDTVYEGDFKVGVSIGDSQDKAIRGGSWMLGTDYALARYRDASEPHSRSGDNGFRVLVPIAR